jgi:hypothetical protein
VLMPPVDVCLARVLARESHGFRDEPATRHMYAAFVDAKVDGRHVLSDVPNDPTAVAVDAFARFERRELLYPRP